MKTKLADKKCVDPPNKTPALRGRALRDLNKQLRNGWKVKKQHHLEKQFKFDDFKKALAFTNRVGKLADKLNHHPDIFLTYGEVRLQIWTHRIGGLAESDFILAAKINRLDGAA